MNNKGFAITTILYGIMILFCILLVSMLGILSSYRKTQNILTENTNGTRDIIKYEKFNVNQLGEIDVGRIVYCMSDDSDAICCIRSMSNYAPSLCESY